MQRNTSRLTSIIATGLVIVTAITLAWKPNSSSWAPKITKMKDGNLEVELNNRGFIIVGLVSPENKLLRWKASDGTVNIPTEGITRRSCVEQVNKEGMPEIVCEISPNDEAVKAMEPLFIEGIARATDQKRGL